MRLEGMGLSVFWPRPRRPPDLVPGCRVCRMSDHIVTRHRAPGLLPRGVQSHVGQLLRLVPRAVIWTKYSLLSFSFHFSNIIHVCFSSPYLSLGDSKTMRCIEGPTGPPSPSQTDAISETRVTRSLFSQKLCSRQIHWKDICKMNEWMNSGIEY